MKWRLREVVDVRWRPPNPDRPGSTGGFELIGECGHVVDYHTWHGIAERSLDLHKRIYVGYRRKRCTECAEGEEA